jgi:indolepyruvate ferredoxin oxidoreductase alpha subunit
MCPGCPHWYSFAVLKKLGLFVAGDIGCYTLAALPPTSALHTCLCMGAGVTFNEGLRKALPDGRIVGVVGDSTFVHSGIPGLINAVYNKARGIIFILDNSTTAMTGGQQHPGTGLTIRGEPTKKLSLEGLCRSCGADNVDVIDPKDSQAFEALVRKRLDENALSVIIARFPCRLIG